MIGYAIDKYINGVHIGRIATMFTFNGALDYVHIMREEGVEYKIVKVGR